MLGDRSSGELSQMWRACAAIFALTALAFSACAKQQEIAPPAVGQAQPTVCDANHLAGWCRVVCVAACIGDSGFGASEAQLWTRLPLAQGAEGPQSVVDALSASDGCALSDDGFFWYEPQTIEFPPLVARFVRCRGPSVEAYARAQPPLPNWSRPTRSTRTLLVAGSLQDDLSRAGSEEIWALARGSGIPLTWMLGNLPQLRRNRDLYQGGHVRFGDDLQIEPYDDLMVATKSSLPWFQLSATIDGGGHERFIDHDLRMGGPRFWGIAWNSLYAASTASRTRARRGERIAPTVLRIKGRRAAAAILSASNGRRAISPGPTFPATKRRTRPIPTISSNARGSLPAQRGSTRARSSMPTLRPAQRNRWC